MPQGVAEKKKSGREPSGSLIPFHTGVGSDPHSLEESNSFLSG